MSDGEGTSSFCLCTSPVAAMKGPHLKADEHRELALVDSGCTQILVWTDWVGPDGAEEEMVIKCIHGDAKRYPKWLVNVRDKNW